MRTNYVRDCVVKVHLWMSFDVRIRNGRGSVLVAECFRRDARHFVHLLISLTDAHAHGGIQSQCAVSRKGVPMPVTA